MSSTEYVHLSGGLPASPAGVFRPGITSSESLPITHRMPSKFIASSGLPSILAEVTFHSPTRVAGSSAKESVLKVVARTKIRERFVFTCGILSLQGRTFKFTRRRLIVPFDNSLRRPTLLRRKELAFVLAVVTTDGSNEIGEMRPIDVTAARSISYCIHVSWSLI